MAERSFAKEVEQLRIGAGQEFRGEGILGITKALLECGVGYVGGYQGAPISHLMDVLADAQDILGELGVRFEANASEAAATAMLAASVHYPIRGAVAFKGPVGVNVASDALANLASGGVTGGAMMIVGEDYGEGSAIMQERSHAFAMKSQVWLLDPRPNLPSMTKAVRDGFALSEATETPVILQLRIRACHVHGAFEARDNQRPPLSVAEALKAPRRSTERLAMPPFAFRHEQEKVSKRWPRAVEFIEANGLNEIMGPAEGKVGLVLQGGMYNTVLRALRRLGLADLQGNSRIPLYVLNVTYPLAEAEFLSFCAGKDAVLVIEEGQPNYIEQSLAHMVHRAGLPTRVQGKGHLPMAGEYQPAVMLEGLTGFLSEHGIAAADPRHRAPNDTARPPLPDLTPHVPLRTPSFCTGCPERPIFAAMKIVDQQIGPHQIACDIGCHLFSILPPFDLGGTTMGFGLGPASNGAFDGGGERRPISVIGDGGFWHNGLASSIGNAVYNNSDGVIVIVDNYYTAATGGQDILSSRAENRSKITDNSIAGAVRGVGVKWVREIDRTYDVTRVRDTLTEALTTPETGPKVIIASSECMLNRQRRERPQRNAAIKDGKRTVVPKFGVDEDVCTGDHACMRLSGCPSLTMKALDDPLRDDPVASIDESCVGCGNCGEVADAAVLCPSFYQVDLVHNPGRVEAWIARHSARLIAALQRRRAARRLILS
ncbi:indolepyruvate ferredoxin oxidoreductase subunit alpha [Cereibacter sphaeroides]|nr:indolepyruvate ferredoxin oxidoreductase subunit alpha [Cereibacter sphaeroides]